MRITCYCSLFLLTQTQIILYFPPLDPLSTLLYPLCVLRIWHLDRIIGKFLHPGFMLCSANWGTGRKLRIGGGRCQDVRLTWSCLMWSGNGCIPLWPKLLSDSSSSWFQLKQASGNNPVSSCPSTLTWSLFLTISIPGIRPTLPFPVSLTLPVSLWIAPSFNYLHLATWRVPSVSCQDSIYTVIRTMNSSRSRP